jgi:molybdopterin/thiamine biosynthesis adenylyltransferase
MDVYLSKGHTAKLCPEGSSVLTTHNFGGKEVVLRTRLPAGDRCDLPSYSLVDYAAYEHLAHVLGVAASDGSICLGPKQSFHVNYDEPEAVVLDGLQKAVGIIQRGLTDPEWNRSELLREFQVLWQIHVPPQSDRLIIMAEPGALPTQLHSKLPEANAKSGLGRRRILFDADSSIGSSHPLRKAVDGRQEQGKGLLLPLSQPILPPKIEDDIGTWWEALLEAQPEATKRAMRDAARHVRSKQLHIVCHVTHDGSPIWFAMLAIAETKQQAPLSPDQLDGWKFCAAHLDTPVSRNSLLPRGGASANLRDKRVCIVGCGSVGGFIADQLAASGVGRLTLMDKERFQIENLHRHYLGGTSLYFPKSMAVDVALVNKYPFVKVESENTTLEDLIKGDRLEGFDLLVLATGDVTLERSANERLYQLVKPPMLISAWVEAYGVGGHATLTAPGCPGCLSCIYHDASTGEFDLYPNVSFIEPGQEVLTRHAGCGSEYLAYSSLDASQTATIAVRLAVHALSSAPTEGVSISWKGPSNLAQEHGVSVSERYHTESRMMQPLPIHSGSCDVCT